MKNITLLFIFLCFVVQIIFSIVSAFSTKRTSENKGGWTMRILAVIIVGSVIFLKEQIAIFLPFINTNFWSYTLTIGIIADIVALLGMLIMIYARVTLGKNWSANVTFKENHELITNGPYAYVRHPIYSGLILIILSVAIHSGNFAWLLLFVLFFFGAYYKARKEEKLLIKHFPDTYPAYMKKVSALIPFIF
jgi:protein-S-isoprenylcysteine O-methyltransferase Ste14